MSCLFCVLIYVLELSIFLLLFKHTDLSHYLEKYPSGLHPHNAKVQFREQRCKLIELHSNYISYSFNVKNHELCCVVSVGKMLLVTL